MIKDIDQKIKEVTIEAIDLAKKMQERTSEAFLVITSIPKMLNRATIEVHPTKRPFPIEKFHLLQHAIGGKFEKSQTECKFTKLTQIRHSSHVRLVINVYFGECLNPQSWDKVEVQRGTRGKVLTPELCDGAEFAIMRGLGIAGKSEKEA